MGALKTTFVLFLLLLAGAVTFLSVGPDRMAGEPFQMVKVEPVDFEKLVAEARAAEIALRNQQAQEQQQQQELMQAQPQVLSQQQTNPQLQQTAQPQAEPTGMAMGLDVPPVTGQTPPSIKMDPNAGITATDMSLAN